MKKLLCIMFVVACLTVMPVCAFANHLIASTEADCDGLTISGTVCEAYNLGHPEILLVYTINVNGEIITGEMWQTVDSDAWECLPFSIYIPFETQMCGDTAISGILEYSDSYEHFNNGYIRESYEIEARVLDCSCDVFCPRTPGYWKTHPKAWPIDSIEIGGETLTKKKAMFILWLPVRGNIEIILKKHMIAAILNVASGSDPSINDVIEQADACLASGLCDKDEKEELKDMLDDYNNSVDCDIPPVIGKCTRKLGRKKAM